ncbi:MAG: hypothetical protein Q4E57_04460 [Eubacteriales bacterium]|nr:hypothetical protein [Eubacteriales bacterium]
MGDKERHFFEKKRIPVSDVMYITRQDRQTVLHLKDGSDIATYIPMKRLIDETSEGSFVIINKGIALAPSYINSCSKHQYTMTDGTVFMSRVHNAKKNEGYNGSTARPENVLWSTYSILEESPLAFCVIELVFDESGHGMEFIFRYCNREMEILEGKTREEMLNRSFYEIFTEGDRKWLVTYADVALNGVQRVIESYSPEVGHTLRIYCHQPKQNFCACAIVKV